MREALALRATGGEVAHALRAVWGTYQPNDAF
jgi:methylmalonyl-CoA mutase N-terminal domain/subunit